jgi:hypothetical protein
MRLLEEVNLVEKQCDAFMSSSREASFEMCSMEAQMLKAACEQLKRSKSKLDEVLLLEKQLKAEKSKRSKQVELMKEMSKLILALEDKSKSLESNVLNAKTTLRILQNNAAHLKDSVRDVWKENAQLQESCKQLSQEAQVWKEPVSELMKQKTTVYTQLGEVDTIKEDFTKHIKNLQTRQATVQAEKTWFEIENQKLQQNLKTTAELHEEKRMIYCMKFMAEDHYRLETEKKLSQAQEKTSHAAEELETCKKVARELEENLERINRYYQKRTLYYQKKAHLNWLVAQNSEKQLNYLTMVKCQGKTKIHQNELRI